MSERSNTGTVSSALLQTPLFKLHCELGAKLVPFASYQMPLQYGLGIIKEHQQVRARAGLFDVSHMGQAILQGPDFIAVATALETLVPADILALKPGKMRYTQLLNAEGGIIDDLMVTRTFTEGVLSLVVNASRKAVDFEHIGERLPSEIKLIRQPERALLALQGPEASHIIAQMMPGAERLSFLSSDALVFSPGRVATVSRSGYTGEDGFEISIPAESVEDLARSFLAYPGVLPIGLGARDSLRLEAGLCLYGQDMDEATSPVEAALAFSIAKRRQDQGGFPGANRIRSELKTQPARIRVGLKLQGRSAARNGMEIADKTGVIIGKITSGAFTPTASASVAMGYVPPEHAFPGNEVAVLIRGIPVAAHVTPMPFVPHRYFRKS